MKDIFISLLSGTVGGVLLTYIMDFFKMKKQYIREQIDKLYGPLYFCIIRMEADFEIAKRIDEISEKHDIKSPFSDSESNQVVDLTNEYGRDGALINKEIYEILKNNCSFLDIDDINVVQEYINNFERLRVEHEERRKLPAQIFREMGDIVVCPEEFSNKIKLKFSTKKEEVLSICCFLSWIKKFRCIA